MPNHMTATSPEEGDSLWLALPDSVLLYVFQYLTPRTLLHAMQVCKRWHRVARDEFLWKDLFYNTWKIDRSIPMAPGKTSWLNEFKRLYYETPQVESECVKEHRDQVLHVSFSHAGDLFATSSKDGYVKVWTATQPVRLKYCANMKEYTWKYTQFTQFNSSDTLLLVSGVHFGWQSTSGEIAVFNIVDGFEIQCRVLNKPYDIFGTWYNDNYLLSGNLYWMGHLASCSVLWMNKAYQDLESELESVVMRMYKFKNINASSIRTIMVADCLDPQAPSSPSPESCDLQCSFSRATEACCCHHKGHGRPHSRSHASGRVKVVSKDGTIEYNADYHKAQSSCHQEEAQRQGAGGAMGGGAHFCRACNPQHRQYTFVPERFPPGGSDSDSSEDSCSCGSNSEAEDGELNVGGGGGVCYGGKGIPTHGNPCYPENRKLPVTPSGRNMSDSQRRDKYLVFTMGMKTYTPHQIGIKRIRWEEAKEKLHEKTPNPAMTPEQARLLQENPDALGEPEEEIFDEVDELIEMHGHIIGMALSPDHRYLYVNSRPWPKDAVIDNPLYPPPIAQEIDIHVVDIVTMKQVGLMHRAHKAYTPDDECFFIFLDVCDQYVASGAEDQHGYLWDRHYGTCLTKFPHTDVVNAVAFNPADSQMLVTVSDDHSFKVWRSRQRQNELDQQQLTEPDML